MKQSLISWNVGFGLGLLPFNSIKDTELPKDSEENVLEIPKTIRIKSLLNPFAF